jgi:hypothetical protein
MTEVLILLLWCFIFFKLFYVLSVQISFVDISYLFLGNVKIFVLEFQFMF